MAPSSDTITGWTNFTGHTKIKSSEMMANFSQFRGHLLPFDASITAAANNTYNLGSATYKWKGLYCTTISATSIVGTSITGTSIVGTTITGTSIVGTTLTGTSIVGTTITATSIVGTTVTATQLFLGSSEIKSGTYTPAASSGVNLSADTQYTAQYLRVGNVVTVSGRADFDAVAGANAATSANLSLPIASNFTGREDCVGVVTMDGTAFNVSGAIYADATNDKATLTWLSPTTANSGFYFHFTYQIK